jgi:heavy metal sensor kinase
MSSSNVRTTSFFRSIRFRLTAGYVVVLLFTVIAVSFYFYHSLKFALMHDIALFLENEFAHNASYIAQNYDQRNLIIHELNARVAQASGNFDLYYALFDIKGDILAKSGAFAEDSNVIGDLKKTSQGTAKSLSVSDMSRSLARLPNSSIAATLSLYSFGKSYKDSRIRLLSRPVERDGTVIYYLQLGVDIMNVERVLSQYRITIILALPIILMLAGLGGYLLAWRYLRPISNITKAAQDITLSNVYEKALPTHNNNDELDHLAETFNQVFFKLAESYKQIAQFTADASHELRIPITTLKGEAEVVLDRERSLAEYQRVLESSIEEYNRLSKMLNDLLILSRSDLGDEKIEFDDVDLSALMNHMIEFLRPLAACKNILFEVSLAPQVIMPGNKIMLERLFLNILDNAIKYSPHDKRIFITLKQDNAQVKIAVKDQGPGIPAEHLPRIFDRFYRVDRSRSRELGGSGLGLSISKMIATMHNGTITVVSEDGVGTEVTVVFPRV